ncbi:copper resistance CopC family protein, partial [Micromonospora tulbaghiae]
MGGRVARVARTWAVVLGVVAASALLPAAPAAAHNSLTGSDPRDGARLAAAPERIELRFLATPKEATTEVTVTGPDNVAATGGAPAFAGKRVTVPFRPGAAGLYIVTYRLASDDGHPVKGEIRFTLTAGTPAESPSASAPPTSAAPAPSTALPTSAAPSPTPAAA